MFTKVAYVIILFCNYAHSRTTYDQSQNGDLNVQIDFKNLKVFAVTKGGKEEYVDYDYAYDYSEMTIKPLNGTTPKPLNATTVIQENNFTDNSTLAPAVYSEITVAPNNESVLAVTENNLNTSNKPISTTLKSIIEVQVVSEESNIKNVTMPTVPSSANSTECKKNATNNQKGNCDVKLQNTGNALLKLVKLSQKLKLRRENRRGTENS